MTEHTDTTDAAAHAGSRRGDGAATTDESSANTMGDVDHTHPHRNTTFGSVFRRGPTVAADGGAPAAATQAGNQMAEIDHESPVGRDPNDAFARGIDSTDESNRDVSSDTRGGASDE